jgi:hypothetical protein
MARPHGIVQIIHIYMNYLDKPTLFEIFKNNKIICLPLQRSFVKSE